MKDIEVEYSAGNEIMTVILQQMLDGNYHGQIVKTVQGWRVYLEDKSDLNNLEDMQMLIEIVEQQE
jgi:hypothetical protein